MQYANGSLFDVRYAQMYSPRMSISDQLDKAMKAAKIPSQSELARKSGVPQATISRILKGIGAKGPETETIRKLADACGVAFDFLLEGKDGQVVIVEAKVTKQEREMVTPEEIIELLTAYKDADPKDREWIMSSAKTAAKRSARKRAESSTN